jgi:hypothetical protein
MPATAPAWSIGNVGIRFIANRPAFSVKIVDSAE